MARILLVDDDESLRPMIQMMLERLRHEVTPTTDGALALKQFGESQFDLGLTDLVMPNVEGLEMIRRLVEIDPGARIIAMSGGGRGSARSYLQVAAKLGAKRVLAKPFSFQELAETLDAVLIPADEVLAE